MKSILLFSIYLFSYSHIVGQTKTISGRVLFEDLESIPQVIIKNLNNEVVGKTDLDGKFQIVLPKSTDELIFSYIGSESSNIKFSQDCNTLEVIMLNRVIYDFVSLKKEKRFREKRLKILPELYQKAFRTGLFKIEIPCYEQKIL